MIRQIRSIVILVVSILSLPAIGQDRFTQVTKSLSEYKNQVLEEKIFVHLDRSFYLTGDYLRCKVYCVDASDHQLVDLSRIVYAELLDNDQKPVLQAKILINDGTGQGSLFLPASINSGNYTFRAYTRWMQNFSPEFYYHEKVTIVNPFRTPENAPQQNTSAGSQAYFFPEGGWLVDGLQSKVGFKVVDNNGRGVSCKGVITNAHGEKISTFESFKFGMGNFDFTPEAGEQYKVTISDSLGRTLVAIGLPTSQKSGHVLRLAEVDQETLEINVSSSPGMPSPEALFLVGHTRGIIQVQEKKTMLNGRLTFLVPKAKLPDGISSFTVFNAEGAPVAERLYFKPQEHQLNIAPKLNEQSFEPRSKVDLTLLVNEEIGKGTQADLSISIIRIDSLEGAPLGNISTQLLLTSDLIGNVESPRYYFGQADGVRQAADNLMLTQGWRRFVWKEVIDGKRPAVEYIPEHSGHIIVGKAINTQTNSPSQGVIAYLSVPGKTFHLRGSRSNKDGVVRFEMVDFYGANKIITQPDLRVDSLHRIEIKNPFSSQVASFKVPPLDLPVSMASQLQSRSMVMQMENIYLEKERAKVILPKIDSAAFYNSPDARYYLDTYTRFPTVEDVMREYVPGVFVRKQKKNFHFSVVNKEAKNSFSDDPLVLLDGVPVFNINHIMDYDPLKIQKLEVVTHRYYYGPVTFSGIVSFTTYQGDLKGFPLSQFSSTSDYPGVEWVREFYAPRYDTPDQLASRMPDFRNLLMWIPDAKSGPDGVYKTSFYTSDQEGKYAIVINGISSKGQFGGAAYTFEVKSVKAK